MLPGKVVIGPVDWTVIEDADLIDRSRNRAGDDRWGESDKKLVEILIDPSLPPSRKREVLMHEVVHAVLYEWHVDKVFPDNFEEEPLVEILGVALLATIRDNPDLISFLWEEDE